MTALILAASAGIAIATRAAEPPPAAGFGETLEVRVVNLEVVVTDRDGLPVTGLSAADFKLQIDGKEVPINYFTEVRGGDAVEASLETKGSTPAMPDLVPGTPVGTSYLVFVDDYFALGRDRNHVLDKIGADLGRLGPSDRMAIVAYDGLRLTMLTSWTNSVEELARAIRKAKERPAHGLERVTEKRSLVSDQKLKRGLGLSGTSRSDSLGGRLDISERFFAETLQQQIESVVSAATAALHGFANPPGRKVFLLLSGGWPFDPAEFAASQFGRPISEPEIRRGDDLYAPLVDSANQLGYTLYAVDVPGLGSDESLSAENQDPSDAMDRASGFLRESDVEYSLQYVAQKTGGRALVNAYRDLALARAAADTRSYYWVGFIPKWQGDDSRHTVKLTSTRAGLRVRSRTSYLDSSRRREATMAVESVLLFGNPPGSRALGVEFGKPEKAKGGHMRVAMRLAIPLAGFTFLPHEGKFETSLELRIAALDDHGGRSDIPILPLHLGLPAEPKATDVGKYETQLELRRVRNHLAIGVYDPVSGVLYTSVADVAP